MTLNLSRGAAGGICTRSGRFAFSSPGKVRANSLENILLGKPNISVACCVSVAVCCMTELPTASGALMAGCHASRRTRTTNFNSVDHHHLKFKETLQIPAESRKLQALSQCPNGYHVQSQGVGMTFPGLVPLFQK